MSRPPALHLPRARVVATTLHRFQALVGAGRYAETGVEHPAPRQVATLVGMLLLLLRGHGPIVLGCAAALLLDAIAGRLLRNEGAAAMASKQVGTCTVTFEPAY